MIYCEPKRLFTWDYTIRGEGHDAVLSRNWIGEQGSLVIDGIEFEVEKHGFTSGMWTMYRQSVEYAVAQKTRPATRSFEIQAPSGLISMRPMSPLKRSFILERSDEMVGTVKAVHPFTRRAQIDLSPSEDDFPAVCFAFWLAILTWKRRRRAGS